MSLYCFFQVWCHHLVLHLCILGFPDRQHLVPDGRSFCLLAHPPSPLGRIPIEVLQGRRIPLCTLLVQDHSQTSRFNIDVIQQYESPYSDFSKYCYMFLYLRKHNTT